MCIHIHAETRSIERSNTIPAFPVFPISIDISGFRSVFLHPCIFRGCSPPFRNTSKCRSPGGKRGNPGCISRVPYVPPTSIHSRKYCHYSLKMAPERPATSANRFLKLARTNGEITWKKYTWYPGWTAYGLIKFPVNNNYTWIDRRCV